MEFRHINGGNKAEVAWCFQRCTVIHFKTRPGPDKISVYTPHRKNNFHCHWICILLSSYYFSYLIRVTLFLSLRFSIWFNIGRSIDGEAIFCRSHCIIQYMLWIKQCGTTILLWTWAKPRFFVMMYKKHWFGRLFPVLNRVSLLLRLDISLLSLNPIEIKFCSAKLLREAAKK